MPFFTIIIFGALAGCFALLFELALITLPFVDVSSIINFDALFSLQAITTLLVVAFIEEVSKYIFLLRYAKYTVQKPSSSLFFSVFLALLFGIGFFSLELIFSLQNIAQFSLIATVKTLFLHISTSFLFIYFVFSSSDTIKFFSRKSFWLISVAVLLHLIYNITILLTT